MMKTFHFLDTPGQAGILKCCCYIAFARCELQKTRFIFLCSYNPITIWCVQLLMLCCYWYVYTSCISASQIQQLMNLLARWYTDSVCIQYLVSSQLLTNLNQHGSDYLELNEDLVVCQVHTHTHTVRHSVEVRVMYSS